MENNNVFAFIKERDLYTYFINMIQSGKDLDRGINCTDKKDNENFKYGAIWGIAWFLISVCANCEKVYLKEEPRTEEEVLLDSLIKKNSVDGKFDADGFFEDLKDYYVQLEKEKKDEKE